MIWLGVLVGLFVALEIVTTRSAGGPSQAVSKYTGLPAGQRPRETYERPVFIEPIGAEPVETVGVKPFDAASGSSASASGASGGGSGGGSYSPSTRQSYQGRIQLK